MSLVRGENFILFVLDGGQYKPLACSRSAHQTITTEMLETSVTGSGNFKTFEPTFHSSDVGMEGIIALNESNMLTLPELQALQLAKTKIYVRFMETANDGTIYRKEFYAFITSSTDTGSFDGIATFSISMQVTGAISQIFTPPSPTTGIVYRYPAMGDTAPVADGTYTVEVEGLGNKTILSVNKDGLGNNDIILSGTPVAKEVLYETSGTKGLFTWAVPFEGETWFCLYQNN